MIDQEEKKKQIQVSAEYLANLCLECQDYNNYTDIDLLNATLIFSHFLHDKLASRHKLNLDLDQMSELAEEMGKSIRQTILVYTGKDMHEVAKSLKDKNENSIASTS